MSTKVCSLTCCSMISAVISAGWRRPIVSAGPFEFGEHPHRGLAVGVEDRDAVGAEVIENAPLGLAVVVERAVPIEVVAADVRDADGVEFHAGERRLNQVAARDFDDRVRESVGGHLAEPAGEHRRRKLGVGQQC